MRKSNLVKILVAILAFSLLLGTIVGITTAADEGDVYLENADVERNVQYESKTYLLYRVTIFTFIFVYKGKGWGLYGRCWAKLGTKSAHKCCLSNSKISVHCNEMGKSFVLNDKACQLFTELLGDFHRIRVNYKRKFHITLLLFFKSFCH